MLPFAVIGSTPTMKMRILKLHLCGRPAQLFYHMEDTFIIVQTAENNYTQVVRLLDFHQYKAHGLC